jgi:tight adherence protein C
MGVVWIGLCLFTTVLSVVTMAGYWFFLRPAAARQRETALVRAPIDTGKLPEVRGALVELFRSVGEKFPGSHKERNPYRQKLLMAGYRWSGSVAVYYGIKCASTFLFAGLFGIAAVVFGEASNPLLPMFCGAGCGFLLTDRVLDIRARHRVARLRSGLPAALDLMILGIESGQSLDLTIADASRGLRVTHPDLSDELAQLQLELRAGHTRTEAFHNLAERNRDQEMRRLCNVFVDSDRFGTSLGPALRTHAKYLRTRFRNQAQEKARKVGVKLIFPVFFLIFPSVLLVTLGPAVMMVFQQLKTMLQ